MRITRLRDYPAFLPAFVTRYFISTCILGVDDSCVTCTVCVTSGIRASLAVALVVIIHQPWLQLLFRSADNHVPCTITIEDHVERSSPRFARFVKPRVNIIFLRLFQLLFIGEKSRKINTKNKKRSIFPFIKLFREFRLFEILIFF